MSLMAHCGPIHLGRLTGLAGGLGALGAWSEKLRFWTLAVAERTVLCVRRGRPPIYTRGRADPTRSACGSLNLDFPLRRIRFVAPVSVERISDRALATQIADRADH